jgi:2-dehydro-3-deoxyphosphooctonate aldolase (KDO 8-P synthase)
MSPPHPAVVDLFSRRRFTLIAGPCVAESYELCRDLAQTLKAICAAHDVAYIFKASFDKANRTAHTAFRGHGMQRGLELLARVRQEVAVPVLTDIHHPEQAAPVAAAVDVLQIPAFLCRQTDLLEAAARTGCPTNVKKGQFLAPQDMRHVVAKYRATPADVQPVPQLRSQIAVTERGSCFGYHNLVVDMRGLVTLRETTDAPVIFDATHSVQRPSAGDGKSLGDRHMAPVLARAAAAVGIDGLFCEVHFNPDKALSDGPNSLDIPMFEALLGTVCRVVAAVHGGTTPPAPQGLQARR